MTVRVDTAPEAATQPVPTPAGCPLAGSSACVRGAKQPELLQVSVITENPAAAAAFYAALFYATYRMLASGKRDFSLYNRLWPWDHAAGILLHAEAGGYSARVDHAPYRPIDRVQGLLSAPNEETWREIDAFLRPA